MQNQLPASDQLAVFFGKDPSEVFPDEGLSVFRVSAGNMGLAVSIGEVARSFQTNLCVGDALISSVAFEGLDEVTVPGDKTGPFLRATFATGNAEISRDNELGHYARSPCAADWQRWRR